MKVFKFGGASVKDADAVKNVANILKLYEQEERLVVVISAMGKTTNALEKLLRAHYYGEGNALLLLQEIKDFHLLMVAQLFNEKNLTLIQDIETSFVEIEWAFEEENTKGYDYLYDQVVSQGELIATKIVAAYLAHQKFSVKWVDARDLIKTDNNYREPKINWEETKVCTTKVADASFANAKIIITQGFIGATSENHTTTLGREGSDYTASILAYSLDATEVIIWKDVPGVLNADPKQFNDTRKLDTISYQDAIELAYFGASVIHPKTIQPLQNKNIPLYVKSFVQPLETGTLIAAEVMPDTIIPSFIVKRNQVLISIEAKDFSFIVEENLGTIFTLFALHKVKINLMQNSAISFSICVDDSEKLAGLIEQLRIEFKVLYNKDLLLYTIRHYNQATIELLTGGKTLLLEQKSRHTVQLVVR